MPEIGIVRRKHVFAYAKDEWQPCGAGPTKKVSIAYLQSRGGYSSRQIGDTDMAKTNAGRGFFRGAMDALVAARTRQADRYINSALLMLDDETLRQYGYKREDLQKKGSGGYMF
jgi:hypothetical protein